MHDPYNLIDGEDNLDRRTSTGERAILLAESRAPWDDEEREQYATDVISDILTALFGPAGISTVGGSITMREDAVENAKALLNRALRSWEGDAEDYTRRPEPGEYGYEADDSTEYSAPDRTTITVELDVSGSGTFGGLKRNVASAMERGGLTGIRGIRVIGMRGNPAEFKQGYDVVAAFNAACSLVELNGPERAAIRRALDYLDRRGDPAAVAAMTISFAGEAYESFQAWVERGIESLASARYFVQVTEAESGERFDAWLIGIDREAEMGDTVRIVRNDDDGATDPDLTKVESVRADRVHIY